jgi:hypothetical protein
MISRGKKSMSLVKDIIQSLAEKGKIVHKFIFQEIEVEMEILTTEEQMLADGMVDFAKLQLKYKAELQSFRDGIDKFRSLSLLSFAIKKMGGQVTIDKGLALEEQQKQRIEFRDELAGLGITAVDFFLKEYNKLIQKHNEFLEKKDEIAGK